LSQEKNLAPGDFHTVRRKYTIGGKKAKNHEELYWQLLKERELKLEKDCKSIGFLS
jgi:hypothetical protein